MLPSYFLLLSIYDSIPAIYIMGRFDWLSSAASCIKSRHMHFFFLIFRDAVRVDGCYVICYMFSNKYLNSNNSHMLLLLLVELCLIGYGSRGACTDL